MKNHTSINRVLFAGAALTTLAVVPLARADYPSTVLSQGPVVYYRLNETTSPANVTGPINSGSLGSAANGVYNNFPTRGVTGPFAGSTALGLDGVSQYANVPYQAGLNTSTFSVELWVNPAQTPKFAYVASSAHLATSRSGWYLAQDDGSTFGVGSAFVVRMFNQNGVNPAITLYAPVTAAGVWCHLVLTYDGSTATLYTNGVAAMSGTPAGYVGNVDATTTFGCRSDLGFPWPGKQAEVAMYNSALSAARVSAHYSAGTTTPGSYATTVGADSPVLYYRFQEPPNPTAPNLGTLGNAADGTYFYDAQAGSAGPNPPDFPGFDAANHAATFDAGVGTVKVPPMNLNTANLTISGWFKVNGAQAAGAGLVVGGSGASATGLIIDPVYGGTGLGYIWNGSTDGWSPTSDTSLPALPDGSWAYAALVVQPHSVAVYICDNNYSDWATASPLNALNHTPLPFSTATLIGNEAGSTALAFNGSVDEVAVFNRSLAQGELYTQYGAAVGNAPVRLFNDLVGPSGQVAAGDPITLSIDAGGTPPLTYTWHKNGSTVATTSTGTYTIPNSGLGDSGNYDVTVTGIGSPVQSQTVPVTVVNPSQPVIVSTEGFYNRTLYPTGTLALAVSATGGGLKYQWYKNTSPIASGTASSYIVPRVTTADAGSYSVSVTNSVGHASNGPVVITIPSVTPGSYAAVVVASGPEAWWRLDEASGTNLFDGMGRHNGYYTNANGSGSGPTLGAPGVNTGGDTAASFNRNGGIGYVPFSADLNSPIAYTYEAWVKTSDLSTFQVPFSSVDANGGLWWAMATGTSPVTWEPGGTGGYYNLWDNGSQTYTMLPVASGVWTHLVMVYSAGSFPWTLFVNGRQVATSWSLPPNTINASGPFIIGCGSAPNPQAGTFFNGQIDEVAVYKRALSVLEVTNHFAAGFPLTPPTFAGPFLPQTVTAGKSVSFSTLVQGSTPIRLQWYKGSTLLTGQTSNTFSIASTAVSDTGTYTLWATNSAGTNSQSASLTVIAPTAYANVTNGLVLHLRFDGDTADTSGNGNNGTAAGGPTFVPGIIGSQALHYSTTTTTNNTPVSNVTASAESYVTLGTPADLQFGTSTSWSVSLWVKLPSGYSSGDLPFIGSGVGSMNNPGWDLGPTYGGGGWQWCLNDGVTVQPTTNNIDVSGASGSINDGNWHNFVLAVDRSGAVAKTYLDGVLLSASGLTGLGSVDNGQAIVIGQDPTFGYPSIPTGASQNDLNTWGTSPSATLDDIGIWRRALSPLEVAQIQSAGSTGGHSFDTVAPPVTLSITRSGGNVVLSWSTGTLLESTTLGPTASWTPVAGATAPSYTVAPSASSKFYRVQVQ